MDRIDDAFMALSREMTSLPLAHFRAPANKSEPIASLIAKVEARRQGHVRASCGSASR